MRLAPALSALILASPAAAQDFQRIPSHCIALAHGTPGVEYLQKAAWTDPVPDATVRLQFVNHAMYLLQTAGGLNLVTDFNGRLGGDFVPDVVTMNNAHSSHFTWSPDPRIPHVLRGWEESGGPADHYLDLGEILVRNVPTTTRDYAGGERDFGNSIFIFEAAGLCIGHLGHLHHEPTPEQYAMIGRLDVVMVPVDGGLTLDHPTMIRTLKRFRSSIVLPMHWFGEGTLQRFLDGMSDDFRIDRVGTSALEISLNSLPSQPTVMVLDPEWVR